MESTSIAGRVVAWERYGDLDGDPIVWCHGGLSSRLDGALAESGARRAGACLISIDRPGIGGSAPRPGATVADWAGTVGSVMDHLGHERFAVAGWSAGGPFALACAHGLGPRVLATATVAGAYPVLDPARRAELGLLLDRVMLRAAVSRPPLARGIVRLSSAPPDAVLRAVLRASARPAERHGLDQLPKAVVTGFLREAVRQGPSGVVEDYRALGTPWGFGLDQVHAPVTVWQGDADPVLPRAHGERLAAELPAGELRLLPGAGHLLPLTHATEVFQDLVARRR